MSSASTESAPRRFRWLRRFGVLGLCVLIGVGLMRWWWGIEAHRRLEAEVEHLQALGEPILREDFDREPVPEQENAAVLYAQAMWIWDSTQQESGDDLAYLADNEEALALIRHARSLPHCDWDIQLSNSILNPLLLDLVRQRQLALQIDDGNG